MSSRVTAVEGGHVSNIDEANEVIRQIVESRNESRREAAQASPAVDSPAADNPKDTIGAVKLPLHLWPTTATAPRWGNSVYRSSTNLGKTCCRRGRRLALGCVISACACAWCALACTCACTGA